MITGRKYKAHGIHTGSLLEKKLAQLHVSKAELGRRINRSDTTILGFTRQPSMQTALMTEISLALKYNLFTDIVESLPAELRSLPEQLDAVILQERFELESLRKENEYLKRIIEGLTRGR